MGLESTTNEPRTLVFRGEMEQLLVRRDAVVNDALAKRELAVLEGLNDKLVPGHVRPDDEEDRVLNAAAGCKGLSGSGV